MPFESLDFNINFKENLQKSAEMLKESDLIQQIEKDAPFNKINVEMKDCDRSMKSFATTASSTESILTPRNDPQPFFETEDKDAFFENEDKDTGMHSSILEMSSIQMFEQANLNREQTAKILRDQIAKFQELTNPDYGFRIRFSHTKLLTQALHGSFEEIINMRDEKCYGQFFNMKDKTNKTQEDNSQSEDLKLGEDFHNPMYDAKLVHPLGRFNQTFTVFKGMYVDQDTVNWCQSSVGKKKGPYPVGISLPTEAKLTDHMDVALDQIKSRNWSKSMTIPALFVVGILNFDKFNGKLVKNHEYNVILDQGINVYVLQVQKLKVEEDTMLANYLTPGEEITVVYLFND